VFVVKMYYYVKKLLHVYIILYKLEFIWFELIQKYHCFSIHLQNLQNRVKSLQKVFHKCSFTNVVTSRIS